MRYRPGAIVVVIAGLSILAFGVSRQRPDAELARLLKEQAKEDELKEELERTIRLSEAGDEIADALIHERCTLETATDRLQTINARRAHMVRFLEFKTDRSGASPRELFARYALIKVANRLGGELPRVIPRMNAEFRRMFPNAREPDWPGQTQCNPTGRIPSIDASFDACMRKETPWARANCLKCLIDTLKLSGQWNDVATLRRGELLAAHHRQWEKANAVERLPRVREEIARLHKHLDEARRQREVSRIEELQTEISVKTRKMNTLVQIITR
ncbi:MAG TPA: hypothetical protein VN641_08150 [Urbifossiella sp.]|nr:hypothetical protein [Urbifossiella sp.]